MDDGLAVTFQRFTTRTYFRDRLKSPETVHHIHRLYSLPMFLATFLQLRQAEELCLANLLQKLNHGKIAK